MAGFAREIAGEIGGIGKAEAERDLGDGMVRKGEGALGLADDALGDEARRGRVGDRAAGEAQPPFGDSERPAIGVEASLRVEALFHRRAEAGDDQGVLPGLR